MSQHAAAGGKVSLAIDVTAHTGTAVKVYTTGARTIHITKHGRKAGNMGKITNLKMVNDIEDKMSDELTQAIIKAYTEYINHDKDFKSMALAAAIELRKMKPDINGIATCKAFYDLILEVYLSGYLQSYNDTTRSILDAMSV